MTSGHGAAEAMTAVERACALDQGALQSSAGALTAVPAASASPPAEAWAFATAMASGGAGSESEVRDGGGGDPGGRCLEAQAAGRGPGALAQGRPLREGGAGGLHGAGLWLRVSHWLGRAPGREGRRVLQAGVRQRGAAGVLGPPRSGQYWSRPAPMLVQLGPCRPLRANGRAIAAVNRF
jgi:hypothetical protein